MSLRFLSWVYLWTNGEAGEVMKRDDVPDWPLLATYLISEACLQKDSG